MRTTSAPAHASEHSHEGGGEAVRGIRRCRCNAAFYLPTRFPDWISWPNLIKDEDFLAALRLPCPRLLGRDFATGATRYTWILMFRKWIPEIGNHTFHSSVLCRRETVGFKLVESCTLMWCPESWPHECNKFLKDDGSNLFE